MTKTNEQQYYQEITLEYSKLFGFQPLVCARAERRSKNDKILVLKVLLIIDQTSEQYSSMMQSTL